MGRSQKKKPTLKLQTNPTNPKLNRLGISKTLSLIEARRGGANKDLKRAYSSNSFLRTLCFTGPAGVGKSSLISRLLVQLGNSKRVAWLACDPSSIVSGGSVLGDRIRLAGQELGEGLFVRSLSTRSTQAFSPAVRDMEVYLETLFDEVWVETAGSGQTQQEVARISGLTVLVLQPETGDDIQWMKSGVRELADIFIVHKSDLPGADQLLQGLLESGVAKNRIALISSMTGAGLDAFFEILLNVRAAMDWKRRLSEVRYAYAKDLFLERALRDQSLRFEKQKSKLIKNPY